MITIIGDSIVNGLDSTSFDKKFNVKIKPYGGSTTEDMVDHIKPAVRKRPDHLILHVGTNDITNSIDTLKHLKSICTFIKDHSSQTKISLSSVLFRADKKGIDKKVKILNKKLSTFCNENNLKFVDNRVIVNGHLSKKKLHLNQNGRSVLAKNFNNHLQH